ncbi:uncharacterized protein [Littorina saxatilis]|uniref:MULE transposase domain-containing protein n=1 Tax=Littorina saxatilis TaxID=31220 RepID=A0AAN9B3S6_9CAEN
MAFVLMGDHQVGNYRAILQQLKGKIERLTRAPWLPTLFITDFEQALRAAVHTEFQQAEVRSCYFHLCSAVWKRARQERLAGPGFLRRLGRHWQDVQDLIKKVLALAFLPVALVRQNFQTLFTDPLTANLARQVAGLQVFLAYFRRNYIIPGNVAQPAEWNVYRRDVDTRSNNHVEAWNRRWNATVGRRHPNFWYFLTRVRQEEVLSRGAINAVARARMLMGEVRDNSRSFE